MTRDEAHHLWIRFVGLDNVADTLREEFEALPMDLLEDEDAARAMDFLESWLLAIGELRASRRT